MRRSFDLPVWSRRTCFVDDPHELMQFANREHKKYGEDPLTESDLHDLTGWAGFAGRTAILGVFDGTLQTLVHEATHLAGSILDYAGVEQDGYGENDEPLAYLVDYLFAEWLRRMGWKVKITGANPPVILKPSD